LAQRLLGRPRPVEVSHAHPVSKEPLKDDAVEMIWFRTIVTAPHSEERCGELNVLPA
jgi:hypothetical protein